MVLHVTVKGHQLVALLDSGSMTNFINADLCARPQLASSPRPALQVLVANGDGVPCQGITHNVPLSIDTEASSISCFGITLGSFDLILGYDFLRRLGPILWDFARHCMTFTCGDHHVTWLGVSASADTEPAMRAAITPTARPPWTASWTSSGASSRSPAGCRPIDPTTTGSTSCPARLQ
jgi:hypothetical protein